MFPDIAPADAITNSLASSTPVANVAYHSFEPMGIAIIGVFLGVATLIIIIGLVRWAVIHVHAHGFHLNNRSQNYFDSPVSRRDPEVSAAINQHRHYQGILRQSNRNRISRYD